MISKIIRPMLLLVALGLIVPILPDVAQAADNDTILQNKDKPAYTISMKKKRKGRR